MQNKEISTNVLARRREEKKSKQDLKAKFWKSALGLDIVKLVVQGGQL